jgi:hypothetical protein
MSTITNLAKCGCDCSRCPTYRENLKTPAQRAQCSAGWEKCIGLRISPEKLRPCDGCAVPDKERHVYYLNCKVRRCATVNGINNCAYCEGFPCEELSKVHSLQKINDRREFNKSRGRNLTAAEYRDFVAPYTGMTRLSKFRTTLSEKEIKRFKRFSNGTSPVPSAGLKKVTGPMQTIRTLLASVCVESDISYARLLTLEKKREILLKILWTVCLYGSFNKKYNGLEIEAEKFMSAKVQGMHEPLLQNLKDLKGYGVDGVFIPFFESGWLTPKGGLRKKGWKIRMSFGKLLNGAGTLRYIQEYVQKLNEKYGRKGFGLFKKADMTIMRSGAIKSPNH